MANTSAGEVCEVCGQPKDNGWKHGIQTEVGKTCVYGGRSTPTASVQAVSGDGKDGNKPVPKKVA